MQFGINTWQAFKDHFSQAYKHYHIRKKETSAAHGYGASANHAHESDAQVTNVDALQALVNTTMEYMEAMANLKSINLKLSQSLTQAQEPVLVLSKQLQELQAHTNAKKPATEKPATDTKTRDNKYKNYFQTYGRIRSLDHTIPIYCYPKKGYQVGATLENKMGGSVSYCK